VYACACTCMHLVCVCMCLRAIVCMCANTSVCMCMHARTCVRLSHVEPVAQFHVHVLLFHRLLVIFLPYPHQLFLFHLNMDSIGDSNICGCSSSDTCGRSNTTWCNNIAWCNNDNNVFWCTLALTCLLLTCAQNRYILYFRLFMFVCVCVCVRVCVCVCACVNASIHTYAHTSHTHTHTRARAHTHTHLSTHCVYLLMRVLVCMNVCVYGVATISRLLKIIGFFCRISSLLQGSFAKEI